MKYFHILFIFSVLLIAGCNRNEDPPITKEGKIIVLMYHRIVQGVPSNLYERSVDDLKKDIDYLEKNNINVISFNDLVSISESGKMPGGNSAIITFDDGDKSWFTLALPLLKEYKMKATFFLWVYMIGHDSFLSWKEVELMSYYTLADGIKPFTFGSHSYSHQFLSDRKAGFTDMNEYNRFLDYELGESKRIIEEHTPGVVNILALPFGNGAGDSDIIAAAERNGYIFIRTSINGAISDPAFDFYELPALPMLNKTESAEIGYYLEEEINHFSNMIR